MKKTVILIFGLIVIISSLYSQTAGDYRTAGSGNWGVNSTWERFNGNEWVAAGNDPASSDGIITIRSTHTVIVNSAENGDQIIVESGGVLTITSTLTLNDGPGDDIEVNGTFNLINIVNGAGSIIVTGSGTFTLSTGSVKQTTSNVNITNNGTLSWDEGGLNFSGSVTNNNIFNITANALWQFNGGLTNTGTINKSGGATNIATPWSNSGTINLSGGSLTSSQPFTNTGNIVFTNGASWQNLSTFNHNTGSVISGSGMFANASTFTLNISQVFPATLFFSNTNIINGPGDLTINNDFTIRGSITGGLLILNGNAEWQSGVLGRQLTMAAGQTLLLSTGSVKTLNTGTTLTNNGTMTWQAGGLNFGGAVINNNIFNITASALWQFSGGLTNTGTINKTAGSTIIRTSWSNSGTINLSGGSLNSDGVFTNTGNIFFTNGAAWANSSTFNHNTGSVISGTGSFDNSGTFTLNISQVFPASLIFSNTNIINGPGDLTINNDFTIRGSITGGLMILNGNGDWQSGSLGRSLTMAAGQTLLLSTGSVKTLNTGATLTNNGTLIWQEGGLNFGGAVINNNIFNITASALWQFSGGLTNTGTINKSAGSTIIRTSWNNSGTINLSGGSLNSDGVFTNTGNILFTNGATWANSSTFNHNSGSVVTGTGIFANAGTLSLAIDQVFPPTLIFSNTNTINGAGALTINNDFVIAGNITGGPMTINGNVDFQNGTLGRTMTIDAGSTFLLSTGNVKTFNTGSTLTNNGTLTWQEGILNFGGAIINNNIFNINANNTFWQFSGGLTNNAVVNKTATGAINFATPVTNTTTGTIRGVGTITFSSTFTNSGTIAPGLSPGIITLNGTAPLSATGILEMEIFDGSGVGIGHDQLQRDGNLILAGTLTVTETGPVPDGIYTIIDLNSGTISGSFSNINLPPGYTIEVYTDNVRVAKNVPLSLTLLSFKGRKTLDQKVNLEWTSIDEENVSHFEIQRSRNGRNYSAIAKVTALNNPDGGTYHFTDESPFSQNNYYRLHIVDLDASSKLSTAITVKVAGNDEMSVYPTITNDVVNINTSHVVNARLYSLSHELLLQKQVSGTDHIDLTHLASGLYILVLDNAGQSIKILKQ